MSGKHDLVGCKIVAVKRLTKEQMQAEGWYESAIVLELDNGWLLYPSRDEEGNGPRALFGVTSDAEPVRFAVPN